MVARLLQVLDIEECLGVWGLPWACLMVKWGGGGGNGQHMDSSRGNVALPSPQPSPYQVQDTAVLCSA